MRKRTVLLCAVSFLTAVSAFAAPSVKTVNCNQGKKIQDAIDSVTYDKAFTIEVTGACIENIAVRDYSGPALTITTTNGASITDASGGTTPVAVLLNSRSVSLNGFTINGAAGVLLNTCTGCNVTKNTVNVTRSGIATNASVGILFDNTVNLAVPADAGGSGVIIAAFSNFAISHLIISGVGSAVVPTPGVGMLVTQGSRAQINPATGASEITAVAVGIQVEASASVQLSVPATCGSPVVTCLNVHAVNTGAVVRSALLGAQAATFDGGFAGIVASDNSSVSLFGTTITNHTQRGVSVSDNSHLTLSDTTITSNGPRGIAVGNLSSVTAGGPNNTVSGQTQDLACDATSRVTGTIFLPGVSLANCANTAPASSPLP